MAFVEVREKCPFRIPSPLRVEEEETRQQSSEQIGVAFVHATTAPLAIYVALIHRLA